MICVIMQMQDDTSRRIGQCVREERRAQGLDQRTLALIANVAVRSIHRVEHGESTVRLDVLTRVLQALGLRIDVQGRSQR
jgi:HTH-type transcriptional regulator / antitoxin HipB